MILHSQLRFYPLNRREKVNIAKMLNYTFQYLYSTGPVAVCMEWAGGGFDENGIFRCDVTNSYDHCVVLTGFDDNDNEGCWIAKNSWGANWNGDGYFKIGYGECWVENLAYGATLPDPLVCATCLGDLNGDDQIDLDDLADVEARLLEVGSPFIVHPWDEQWHACGDMNEDHQMDLEDLQALAGILLEAGSPFIVPCGGERAGGGAPDAKELVEFLDMVRDTNDSYRKLMTDEEWEIFISAFKKHLHKKAKTRK